MDNSIHHLVCQALWPQIDPRVRLKFQWDLGGLSSPGQSVADSGATPCALECRRCAKGSSWRPIWSIVLSIYSQPGTIQGCYLCVVVDIRQHRFRGLGMPARLCLAAEAAEPVLPPLRNLIDSLGRLRKLGISLPILIDWGRMSEIHEVDDLLPVLVKTRIFLNLWSCGAPSIDHLATINGILNLWSTTSKAIYNHKTEITPFQ